MKEERERERERKSVVPLEWCCRSCSEHNKHVPLPSFPLTLFFGFLFYFFYLNVTVSFECVLGGFIGRSRGEENHLAERKVNMIIKDLQKTRKRKIKIK